MVVRECHVDMCLGLKKYFHLEQSKRKVQVEAKWHEEGFLGIKDESEIAVVGTPHGIVFSRSIRRVPKEDSGDGMLFNSIRGAPCELQPRAEGGVVNRVQFPEREAPPPTVGERQDEFMSGEQWNWRVTGTQTGVSGANMRDWDCSRRITVRSAVQGLSST